MKYAIVCPPSSSYAQGLTSASLGPPRLELALTQHEHYVRALEAAGLQVSYLDSDSRFPDSCFVEDPAIVTERGFLITRPGAESRRGEVTRVAGALARFQDGVHAIQAPGILDGGDVCQAGNHFWVGISERTNVAGSQQLAAWLRERDYRCEQVDLSGLGLLHLKSGLAYLGEDRVALVAELAGQDAFGGYEQIEVSNAERYAANCVRINDCVLIASGHPKFESALADRGYKTVAVDMSEFEKMDGGISCLSLRW